MSNNLLVSVCIPVYNGEKYISETIHSVLAQTYGNVEIVVQDNASTDGTWPILQALAAQFPQVTICQNAENYGMAANWNLAINRAGGDYVMLLSADDLLMPTFVRRCLSVFERDGVDVVVTNHHFVKAGRMSRRRKYVASGVYRNHCKLILLYNPFSVNFTLFKKSLVERMKIHGNLFRSFMTCDYDLCIRVSLSGVRLSYISEPLGVYRIHESNLSKQEKRMMRQAALVLFSHKNGLHDSCRFAYGLTLLRFVMRALYKFLRIGIYDARLLRALRGELCRELARFY